MRFLLPKRISLGETTSTTRIGHRAIAVPWDKSSSEERPGRPSSWGPNVGRLALLRSTCRETVWHAHSTVLETLPGDRQQCLSLVSESFGFMIQDLGGSLVLRASISPAKINYYRGHWQIVDEDTHLYFLVAIPLIQAEHTLVESEMSR